MCSAFLWSGSPNVTSKAKVSWDEFCYPKEEGGLGIRKIREVDTVFSLKLIWRLFSHSGSLWVAWVNRYMLKQASFWDVRDASAGSWVWRKLLNLRPLAKNFIRMAIHNGSNIRFWTDIWHPLGRIIELTGEVGIQKFGITRDAKICDVVRDNEWEFKPVETHAFAP